MERSSELCLLFALACGLSFVHLKHTLWTLRGLDNPTTVVGSLRFCIHQSHRMCAMNRRRSQSASILAQHNHNYTTSPPSSPSLHKI